ncbi:murein hydrolase activator EnvC family protein [Paramicrobacterium chengjingii]|uniref:murein hydrolase activator EnvC family protein n=1 Tax=Paramicrobacterium chengjingii TaxID=2769067 RepID=UPI001F1B1FE3|nr:M23 family metallopeptidase [Microbacterium chengjingii]
MSIHSSRRRMRGVIAVTAVVLGLSVVFTNAPAAAVHSPADSAANTSWQWPLDGNRRVSRAFEAPTDPWGKGHRGIDAAANENQEVHAPAEGTVFFAGVVVNRPVITIEHIGDVLSSFEAVTPLVSEGESVKRGQVIGTITTGPHCGSDCLHIGVRVHGEYVNPLIFFGGIERAVLLPFVSAATREGGPVDSSL